MTGEELAAMPGSEVGELLDDLTPRQRDWMLIYLSGAAPEAWARAYNRILAGPPPAVTA